MRNTIILTSKWLKLHDVRIEGALNVCIPYQLGTWAGEGGGGEIAMTVRAFAENNREEIS